MPVSTYASGIKIPPHTQLTIVAIFGSLTILENGLDIEIKDNGKGYDVESIAKHDLTQPKENGLGLFIIQTLMDDVKIESKDNQGTIIKMTKYLGVDI